MAILSQGLCSSTLIAPNLLLTARHCVEVDPQSGDGCRTSKLGTPSQYRATLAPNIDEAMSDLLLVSKIIEAPAVDGCKPDIALVQLKENVPSNRAKPIAPQIKKPSKFSSTVVAIGYGRDEEGNAGVRRIREDIPVLCVDGDPVLQCPDVDGFLRPFEIIADRGACQGDSGGGLYDQASYDADEPVVIATVSAGGIEDDGITCAEGVYVRTDSFGDFLVEQAKLAAKDGEYPAPKWAGGTGEIEEKDAGSDAAVEGPAESEDAGAAPVTTVVTTQSGGCAVSDRGTPARAGTSMLVVALAALGLRAFRRRPR